MLDSLIIRNFRGIRTGTLDNLSNINILVGRNNAGKSTVLEIFQFLSIMLDNLNIFHKDGFQELLLRRVARSENLSSLWFDYNQSVPIEFEMKTKDDISAKVTFDNKQTWNIYSEGFGTNYLSKMRNQNGLHLEQPGGSRLTNEISDPFELAQAVDQRIGGSAGRVIRSLLPTLKNCFIIDALFVHQFPLIESVVLPEILRTRKDKVLVSILNSAYDMNIEGLSYSPDKYGTNSLIVMYPSRSVRIDEMGDGFRFSLLIIALLLAYDVRTSLIEEMENHQHPKALRAIVQTIADAALKRNIQLFVTTHSAELIKAFIDAAKDRLDTLRILYFANEDGVLETRPLQGLDVRVLDEMGIDLRLLGEYG